MKFPFVLWLVVSVGVTGLKAQAQVLTPNESKGDWASYIFGIDDDENRAQGSSTPICPDNDPNCRKLEASLRTFKVLPIEVSGGVRFGDGQMDGAIRVGFNVMSFDLPQGDLKFIPFEAVYLPDAGGFRIRVGLLETESLFFCNVEGGARVPPLLSVFENCVEANERIGFGGSLLHFQRDSSAYANGDSRWAARWIAAQVTYAILGNGADASYLKNRLNAFLGMSLDSVLSGPASGTFPRMNIGMSGLVRTDDLKWEARAFVAYRPNVTAFDDYGLETRIQILRNLLLKEGSFDSSKLSVQIPASIGIEARYDRWTNPLRSFGVSASTRSIDSLYVGLIFRMALE